MTRVICVASGKGGVGKTTVVSNIAAALAGFNKSVVAIDGNLTTANLGLHLGISMYPTTLQDVLKGKANIRDAIYHHTDGFKVVPADISIDKVMTPDAHKLLDVFYRLVGEADFVLIDCAAGLGKEASASIRAADEMIIVTNPELTALTDALKLVQMANKYETSSIGVIVNRVRNESNEFPVKDVESFLNTPLLGKVHEDHRVRRAISEKRPVVTHSPRSLPAQQFMEIAARLAGEDYKAKMPALNKLWGWLRITP
jgi:septum site-determining protein MinD